ncbi:MAG: CHAT domain-containing protein [Chloroflexi bacterium]|nr:CHAT domain-containing protein [Chloroflexota bacterium]
MYNADDLVNQLLNDSSTIELIAMPLPDPIATEVVNRLKQEADRHWAINANRSLELAETIVHIGEKRSDLSQMALGMMARGDALKLLGRSEEAWTALEHAGTLYQRAGDEIGWARTRIGRLFISISLNRVPLALADAERARAVFTRHSQYEKWVVLDLNTAVVYALLGQHREALDLFRSALKTAEQLGQDGEHWLGPLYTNIGFTYEALGNFRQALAYHERARSLSEARHESRHLAIVETNIAIIAMTQGHYRRALTLLHQAHELYVTESLHRDAAEVNRILVECYLLLNRYTEARDLARQVVKAFREFGEPYEEAVTLLHLATAEAELGDAAAAQVALDTAEPIFASLSATAWSATTRLRRGRLALQQGDLAKAQEEATAAATCFEAGGQQVNFATARLLHGQALLPSGELDVATEAALTALRIAQRGNVPALRYTAHLLLGRIAETQGNYQRALRRYRAASATVDRVQRGLTITLRPGFLEDKDEALRALIMLHLRTGQAEQALETLERAKSQVLLSYLANREQLRWNYDPRSRSLIEELEHLRDEHQWFYRLAHDQLVSDDGRPSSTITPSQALEEVKQRERRMRTITEQLYLHSRESTTSGRAPQFALADVQSSLSEDTLLIEFYNDGKQLWAFTLDSHSLQVHLLPLTVDALNGLLAQLQVNLAAALQVGPEAPAARNITALAQRILQRLHAALIEPLAARIADHPRLTIVPYGALHYLPFHLFHTGSSYLIDQHEIVVLPAAGLVTQRGPSRSKGALILAHTWDGRLPQTMVEASTVQRIIGGNICYDHAACRTALSTEPTQILHIAAHGEHRLDQPDLSYIQLADGHLYTDDLLQQDLSYELVTLSACETGRANVAAGDELIGLGRGFLYAGAGALITSLWRVPDDTAHTLMEHVYRSLRAGASKAAALRDAQRSVREANPRLHPAFWGAFQLVGDPRPLSQI